MSGSLLEVLTENEYRANRSCVLAGLWTTAVCALICLIGLTGAFCISRWWMCWYAGVIILPILAIAAYAKARNYRGSEIKHLIVLVVTLALTVPHARFGVPCYPLCDEARGSLQLFLDGRFGRFRYWRYLAVHCYPSFAICLSFFAIAMSRLCRDGQDALDHQAKVYARLADVEKGLAIAATMEVLQCGAERSPRPTEDAETVGRVAPRPPEFTNQPKVDTWSTTQIIKCISRCKTRAAADPEFAALVERDPAAAVREVET